jgi:3-mercaptopyruvate sulfurtransferase SseA
MARLACRSALLLPLALVSIGCVLWPEGSGPAAEEMPLAEALARRDRGDAVLIDVRSASAYAQGHIPGALSIPASEIDGQAVEIRRAAKQPILYCG